MRWHLNPRVILVFSEGLFGEAVDEERQQQPVDCNNGDNDADHQLNY